MSDREAFENHATKLGKLAANLLSIEMGARLAIAKFDNYESSKISTQLSQVKKGDQIEWSAFTNSDDLRQTLEKYNKRAPVECRLDINTIVNLRDALAHGRVFGYGNMQCLRLLKFSRKKIDGKVSVELAQDMTNDWFNENIELLNKAINNLAVALDYEKREFK